MIKSNKKHYIEEIKNHLKGKVERIFIHNNFSAISPKDIIADHYDLSADFLLHRSKRLN